MSSSRGNIERRRPQKHQNKTAYKNDLHDTSCKTKLLNSLEITGVCKRCKDKIEWKIKYKKYKPLTVPRKCVSCEQRVIKYAYHIMCDKCASGKNVCSKCCTLIQDEETFQNNLNLDVHSMLKGLSERKRRTVLRQINKLQSSQGISPEFISQVNNLIQNVKNEDDILSEDFNSSDSDTEDDLNI